MGGKEGSRGYLYQAFAATLEALNQEFWDKVFVEFKTKDDKVDIAFETENQIVKTIQVKSSVNLFSKSHITKWLIALIDDYTSKEYQLYLIGACDVEGNKLMKSINKRTDGIMDKETKEALVGIDDKILNNTVRVSVISFEINVLESLIRDSLNRYISKKDYQTDFSTLDMIAKGVNYNFMFLSTKGEFISKQTFDEKIFGWLDYNYGNYINSKFARAKVEVKFYLKDEQRFKVSMDEIKFKNFFGYKEYIDDLKNNSKRLIQSIEEIKLPTYKRMDSNEKKGASLNNIVTNLESVDLGNRLDNLECMGLSARLEHLGHLDLSKFLNNYSEIDDTEKVQIMTKVKGFLDITLNKEFFHVGDLREIKRYGVLGQMNYDYVGSKEEKAKNKLIRELDKTLLLHDWTEEFAERFSRYSVLPMVVENIGGVVDKKIQIKLYVPRTVKVFTPNDYQEDNLSFFAEEFAKQGGVINRVFSNKADSLVSKEEDRKILNYRTIKSANPLSEYTTEDFYSCLEENVGQKIYFDNNDYYVLEYCVEELCPHEIKILGKLLLIQRIDTDIDLVYKITSENSDGTTEGNLTLKKVTDRNKAERVEG